MKTETQGVGTGANMARRSFLKYAGAGAAAVGLLAVSACHKDHTVTPTGIDIGSGDIGILNYAYALEQLEAAFYSQVVKTPYNGATKAELATLKAIRDHEIAHRDFLKKALGKKAIPGLEVDFS